MNELDRLSGLPRLVDYDGPPLMPGELTIARPVPGSRRIRCLVNGDEFNPTSAVDKSGRTNSERLQEEYPQYQFWGSRAV